VFNTTSLSDTFQLYKAKELYVFHYKEKSDYWELIVITIQKNGDLNLYMTAEPKIYAVDTRLKLEEANFIIDDLEVSIKTLNPGFEESLEFRSAIFSGQMKTKTLRKIVAPEHLNIVFKKDGTLLNARDTISD